MARKYEPQELETRITLGIALIISLTFYFFTLANNPRLNTVGCWTLGVGMIMLFLFLPVRFFVRLVMKTKNNSTDDSI